MIKYHLVKIVIKDAYGNSSLLHFKIKKGIINEEESQKDSASYFDQKEFHPGFVNIFESDNLQLILNPAALYDSFAFVHSEKMIVFPDSYSAIHSLESGLVPVHNYFTVRIKANKPVPPELRDKMLIKRSWGGKLK